MDDFTNVGQLLNDMEIERDAALARAEAAERRVAELEAQLATMTILAIDGIGYYVLPGPGVSTSPSSPPPTDSA